MSSHQQFMARCLQLAAMGAGSVSPNPLVGAVLVHEGRIIGEGYHRQHGQPHAEVNCINSVMQINKHLISASTLYVSLEPCAHHGNTPPCADLIIEQNISKVVTGSHDPNPLVAGRGIAKLRAVGVEVTEQVLVEECDFLNRSFITFYTQQRPYIILKWAQSSDGYFAPEGGKQQWLTNEYSKMLTHKWRTEEDAILVGTNTALIDNPQLNSRHWSGHNPVRLLIDMNLRVPPTANIFNDEALTIVYNAVKEGFEMGTAFVKLSNKVNVPAQIAADLHRRKVLSVIIEGGADTINRFIAANLWDEARVFIAPVQIGNGITAPKVGGRVYEKMKLADDSLSIILNQGA